MKRKITIEGLQAVSINSAYYSDKRHGFKPEVKDWCVQFAHQLGQGDNKAAIADIKNYFQDDKHIIHIMLTFSTPKFYTKDGRLNSQSQDLSNVEKITVDALFDYQNSLGINDKYITRMVSEKKFASDFKIEVVLHVKPLPKH